MNPQDAANQEKVPSVWPGAFGLYNYSKAIMTFNVGTLLVLWLTYNILVSLPDLLNGDEYNTTSLIVFLLMLIGGVFFLALSAAQLAAVRGEKLSIGQSFSRILNGRLIVNAALATILVFIILLASLALLVVPLLFVFPRITPVLFFVIDKKMGPIEAIEASFKATKGHAIKIWGTFLVSLAMALLSITIIGIPFSFYFLYMYAAAPVLVYFFITQNSASQPSSVSADTQAPHVAQPTSPINS